MKNVVMGLILVFGASSLLGCNTLSRQPQLKDPVIAPTVLKPDAEGLIKIQVVDRYHIVRKVDGTLREMSNVKIHFRDDGQGQDEKAGDQVWSYAFHVALTMPPGVYHLDVTALRADGLPVPVKHADKSKGPLTLTIPVEIKNP